MVIDLRGDTRPTSAYDPQMGHILTVHDADGSASPYNAEVA